MEIFDDTYFMKMALREARTAYAQNEIPIGAILIDKNKRIIAKGHNQVELLKDATAHAEMLCLSAGFEAMGSKYLQDCTMYISLEPCMMCAGALFWSQIGRIVYAAHDFKRGKIHPFVLENKKVPYLHPKTEIIGGILEEEAKILLQNFFKEKRK